MRLFILTAALLCGVLAAAEVIDRNEFSAGNAAAVPPGFAAYAGREKLGGSRSFATDGGRRVLELVDDRDDGIRSGRANIIKHRLKSNGRRELRTGTARRFFCSSPSCRAERGYSSGFTPPTRSGGR